MRREQPGLVHLPNDRKSCRALYFPLFYCLAARGRSISTADFPLDFNFVISSDGFAIDQS